MNIQTQQPVSNQSASEVLTFLASMREQLADFRRTLLLPIEGQTTHISDVVYDVECRQYESGLTLEMWTEAQIEGGDALTWWLDMIYRGEVWLLDGRVSWNGQDIVFETPIITLPDFYPAQHLASSILEELFRTGKEVLNERLTA